MGSTRGTSLATIFILLFGFAASFESRLGNASTNDPDFEDYLTLIEFEDSEIIFSGTVTEIESELENGRWVHFDIGQAWKGEDKITKDFRVFEFYWQGGIPFEVGEDFLVYAEDLRSIDPSALGISDNTTAYWTERSKPSKPLDSAESDLRILDFITNRKGSASFNVSDVVQDQKHVISGRHTSGIEVTKVEIFPTYGMNLYVSTTEDGQLIELSLSKEVFDGLANYGVGIEDYSFEGYSRAISTNQTHATMILIVPKNAASLYLKGTSVLQYVDQIRNNMTQVDVKDSGGRSVLTANVGNNLTLTTLHVNNRDMSLGFLTFIEIRDSDNTSIYLDWKQGWTNPYDTVAVQAFWLPERPGVYEIRTFSIKGFLQPEILTDIQSSKFEVFG